MAEAAEPDHAESDQISFEPERFEFVSDERLEVSGRWFGVRGRRFVRPTLTLTGESGRIRLLADLEHKPWAAQDGDPWTATFTLEQPAAGVAEAELAVAPDIAVSLSPPPSLSDGSGSASKRSRGRSQSAIMASRLAPASVPPSPQPPPPPAAGQPANEQALSDELAAVRGQLEQAQTELDAAVREREAAVRERDDAVRECDDAVRERDKARKGWKDAHQGWREAVRERDRARTERDHAIAAREELTELRRLTDAETAASLDVLAARSKTPRPAFVGARRPTAADEANWLLRGLALLVLIAAIIALIIVVQSA